MLRIDAHQHFWKYDPVRDSWITDDMCLLRQDYLPNDLLPYLEANNIDGCVLVQSAQSPEENVFQLDNAAAHDFIKGVVGWVDLRHPQLNDQLQHYSSFPKMKGFREILQGNPELMLSADFRKGLGLLQRYGFTYDLLVHAAQLPAAIALVKMFPDQSFVLDHLGKPQIKEEEIRQWTKDIRQIASFENVSCKISGMMTEADRENWVLDDLLPYMDVAVEAFGSKRIMFGSDWPVCLTAASYAQTVNIARAYFSTFTINEQELFWGLNARTFYKLN